MGIFSGIIGCAIGIIAEKIGLVDKLGIIIKEKATEYYNKYKEKNNNQTDINQ